MQHDEKIAEKYLKQRGFRKAIGWRIAHEEMNPHEWEYIFFEGESLERALQDYATKTDYWIYDPNEEQVFEDIWEAVDYAEGISDVDYDDFEKSELRNLQTK